MSHKKPTVKIKMKELKMLLMNLSFQISDTFFPVNNRFPTLQYNLEAETQIHKIFQTKYKAPHKNRLKKSDEADCTNILPDKSPDNFFLLYADKLP